MNKRILAIGAHYDDVEMGCGGTLLYHVKNGDDVIIAVTNADDCLAGEAEARNEEQLKANKISGFKSITFNGKASISWVVGRLDQFKADIVFHMFEKDTHQHHIRSAQIGAAVARKKYITSFIYDSGTSYEFNPNIFSLVDFSEKGKLLQCFKSQLDRKTIRVDIIKKKEMYWASLISNDPNAHAEGFISRKMLYDKEEFTMPYNVIADNVKIGKDFKIGSFCTIEKDVVIGDNVTIMNYVWLKEGTVLEDGVSIDSYCKTGARLCVKKGTSFKPLSQISDDVIIGNDVFIGPDVVILRGEADGKQSPPVIGDGVYIGGCVTILPNVKIGDGAVLGAGSVVTKDVKPGEVVIGNPAKPLRGK